MLQDSPTEPVTEGIVIVSAFFASPNALAGPAALLPSASSMLGRNLLGRRERDNLK